MKKLSIVFAIFLLIFFVLAVYSNTSRFNEIKTLMMVSCLGFAGTIFAILSIKNKVEK